MDARGPAEAFLAEKLPRVSCPHVASGLPTPEAITVCPLSFRHASLEGNKKEKVMAK